MGIFNSLISGSNLTISSKKAMVTWISPSLFQELYENVQIVINEYPAF